MCITLNILECVCDMLVDGECVAYFKGHFASL